MHEIYAKKQILARKTRNKWLRWRIASLRGTRNPHGQLSTFRFLRAVRLWRVNNALQRIYPTGMPSTGTLHPARSLIPSFPKYALNGGLQNDRQNTQKVL